MAVQNLYERVLMSTGMARDSSIRKGETTNNFPGVHDTFPQRSKENRPYTTLSNFGTPQVFPTERCPLLLSLENGTGKEFLHSHCPWGPPNPLTPLSHFSPSAEKNPLSANFKGGLPTPTLFFPLKISILRERTRAGGPPREEPLFSFPLLVQKPFPRLFPPFKSGGWGGREGTTNGWGDLKWEEEGGIK